MWEMVLNAIYNIISSTLLRSMHLSILSWSSVLRTIFWPSDFPTMFSKTIFRKVVKSGDCVVKSYIQSKLSA